MASVPFTVEPAQLTTSPVAYLTAGNGFFPTTKKVTLTNITASVVTCTVYKVPSGDTPGSTNILLDAVNVPPNTVAGGLLELYGVENQTLQPGDALYFEANAATSLNLNISGIQQTT